MLHKKSIQPTAKAVSFQTTSIANAGIMFPLLFMATLSVLLTSCQSEPDEPEGISSELVVSTQIVHKSSYEPRLQLSGTVFAQREANLGAGFPGKVERIFHIEGTEVNRNDLLVEMSGEMLAQAQAEYYTLKRDYERVSRLVQNGTISRQEYDHVKARYDASAAQYRLAQKNTQIRAPFSGVIVDYLVNEGENYFMNFNFEPGYSNTSGILRLMQLDTVKVQTEVNEKDLGRIREGLKASVRVDAFPNQLFEGEISLVKPYLSTRSRTATVEISIPNPEQRLKPGMFARVDLQLPEKEEVFVPMEAVYRDPETGKEKVFVVKNKHVETRIVERINGRGDMLVLTNVFDGEEVVLGGKNRVKSGDKVNIINRKGE